MLYHLFQNFVDSYSFLNIFQYITVRSFLAGVISFLMVIFLTPKFIEIFSRENITENINIYLESSHKNKRGTPNMGGILIGVSVITSCLICGNFYLPGTIVSVFTLCLICYIIFACSGFFDDFAKLRKGKGLSLGKKLLIQIVTTLILIILLYKLNTFSSINREVSLEITNISFPFIKDIVNLGPLYFVLCLLIITGSANAVNMTDGLDGLAIGSILPVLAGLIVLTYVAGHSNYSYYLYVPYVRHVGEIVIFLSAILGGILAFLWFNSNPAQIFMGDVGSIPLGASIGLVSILIKQELLLLILGGVFVIEALSVIIQIVSFRLFRKRIFLIAPLHHHFEKQGIVESKIVVRFWIVSMLLAVFAIITLKLR